MISLEFLEMIRDYYFPVSEGPFDFLKSNCIRNKGNKTGEGSFPITLTFRRARGTRLWRHSAADTSIGDVTAWYVQLLHCSAFLHNQRCAVIYAVMTMSCFIPASNIALFELKQRNLFFRMYVFIIVQPLWHLWGVL